MRRVSLGAPSGAALLTCFCLSLIVLRVARTGTSSFVFLSYNLMLAWVAYGLGVVAMRAWDRRAWLGAVAFGGAFWMMLPNAFYLVTDVVHVRRAAGPLWHDLTLLLGAAAVGTLLSLDSIRGVHARATAALGCVVGWGVVVTLTASIGYGIWLGRVHRLDSWDVLFEPRRVAQGALAPLVSPMQHGAAWDMTALFGGLLLALYVAFAATGTPPSARSEA